MPVAVLDDVKKRVISILNANPGVWSATVSGNVGAFPNDAEILEAILEADTWVATQCYFQSVNDTLAQPFITSTALISGQVVPFHHGQILDVEVSNVSTVYVQGIEAQNIDDITNGAGTETYVGVSALNFLYKIDRGKFYTTASFGGKVYYPLYTRTSTTQCDQNETALLAFRAVAILAKNASPATFDYYNALANAGQQMIIQDGQYTEQADKQQ